jgi:hypothetical protein
MALRADRGDAGAVRGYRMSVDRVATLLDDIVVGSAALARLLDV